MISGAAQADVCLLMVPADGNFTTAIQKGDHKAAEIQGQTRQHARLINLLGVKQLIIGVNKMDTDTAGYKVRSKNDSHCTTLSVAHRSSASEPRVQWVVHFYAMFACGAAFTDCDIKSHRFRLYCACCGVRPMQQGTTYSWTQLVSFLAH